MNRPSKRDDDLVKLYGRGDELAALANPAGKFLVVVGDSGLGKSELLIAAQRASDQTGALPRMLESSAGSLQRVVLEQLGEVLADHVRRQGSAERTWSAIRGVAKQVAQAGARELARVAAEELLALAKGRLGSEVGAALGGFAKEMLSASDASLQERIRTSADPDVVAQLLKLAEEVSTITGRSRTLYLDRIDQLGHFDFDILVDLPERLTGNVHVIAGFTDNLADSADKLNRLVSRGAKKLILKPLIDDDIAQWLADERIPSSLLPVVSRVSDGYPLFVSDAIQAFKAGSDISAIQPDPSFQSILELRWASLEPTLKLKAMQLAAFRELPDDSYITQYLQVDQITWSVLRDSFLESKLFIERADGTKWFHDRRRSFIWQVKMGEKDRQVSAERQLQIGSEWLTGEDGIPVWFVTNLQEALPLANGPDGKKLRPVVELTDTELAMMFSMIELTEPDPDKPHFIHTTHVVAHASEILGSISGAISALEHLKTLGYIYTAQNDATSITTLTIPGQLEYAALIARISAKFGRWPIPRLATSIFESILKPLVSAFESASFGIGTSDITDLAETAKKMSTVSSAPALALNADYDGRQFHAVISFSSEPDRDIAIDRIVERLGAGAQAEKQFKLGPIFSLPATRLRSARYKSLLEIIDQDFQVAGASIPVPQDPFANANQRGQIIEALRTNMNPLEASAAGLARAQSFLVEQSEDEHWILELTVESPSPRTRTIDLTTAGDFKLQDPLFELKLRQAGVLDASEKVLHTSYRFANASPLDLERPLVTTVEDLSKRFTKFNQTQPSTRVAFTPDAIAELVAEFFPILRTDIQSLVENGLARPELLQEMDRRTLLVAIDIGQDEWFGPSAIVATIKSEKPDVKVKFVQQFPELDIFESPSKLLRKLWGAENAMTVQHGSAHQIVAGLAGYGARDLRFIDDPDAVYVEHEAE